MADQPLAVRLARTHMVGYDDPGAYAEPPEDAVDALAMNVVDLDRRDGEAAFRVLVTLRLSRSYERGFAAAHQAVTVLIDHADSSRSGRLRSLDPRKRYEQASAPPFSPSAVDPAKRGAITSFISIPCEVMERLDPPILHLTAFLHHLRSNTLRLDLERGESTSFRNDRPEQLQLADD